MFHIGRSQSDDRTMRKALVRALCALSLIVAAGPVAAEPAVTVLGRDYTFPNRIEGLPARLSDFAGLQVNSFVTSDGVRLAYWEAGQGRPLIFIPAWSANGAEFVNVMYLLSRHYHVYVLDPRNQGLSQRVDYGNRISRFAVDLKDFADHLDLQSADYCGWSMGASVLWSYIDLFGTGRIHRLALIDEPVSIYSHADWSERERLEAGGMTTSPERMIAAFTQGAPTNSLVVDMSAVEHAVAMDSPAFQNSEGFAREFIQNNPAFTALVLFDHIASDWRDVVRRKVTVPTAIFTGELSNNLPSQRWMHSVIPGSTLHVYSAADHGDHFLAFKNPERFTTDLRAFLER